MDLIKYIQRPKIQSLFSIFVEICSECKHERRFSYVESYLNGHTVCKECKSRLKFLTIPLPFAMKRVASYFDMSDDEFKILELIKNSN